jgi:hypothetical protein
MKLRLDKASIRLRLSPSDVVKFSREGEVAESLDVDPARKIRISYRLKSEQAASKISVSFENNCLTVTVPASAADRWVATEEVGMERFEDRVDAGGLRILVEKDFSCKHSGPGRDDDDTFPHPEMPDVERVA